MPLAGEIIRASDMPPEAYTDYTPTLGNWTIGNGTITGTYNRIGDQVAVYIKFTAGSTTLFTGGTPTFTLPVAAAIVSNTDAFGIAQMLDASVGTTRMGMVAGVSASLVRVYNVDGISVGSAVPWTWANGDTIGMNLHYEAA